MVGKVEKGEMELTALLAALDGKVLRSVMEKVKNPPPPLLAQMRALEAKFAFGNFVELADNQIQMLLREIDQRDLVVALKGASPEVLEKFLGNMSERVRTFITEEIGLAHASPEEIFMTQVRIVAVVYRHAERGEIELPAG
jgi:flagellar motor switch protein FliG